MIGVLGGLLESNERQPDQLQQLIAASGQGDLIEIVAEASGPEKSAAPANAWAKAFTEQANALYGGTNRPADEIHAQ